MAKRLRTVTLATQKGGSGTTTIAAMLAVAAAQAGERVVALDLDPQGSLAAWGARRDSAAITTGDRLEVDALDRSRVRQLPEILDALAARGFTLAILDTAGTDDAVTHQALNAADLCLMPARPTRLDIEATRATFRAATALGKPVAFLLNQCPPMPRSWRALEAAAGLKMLGALADPMLTSRVDFQDAVGAGLGVTEFRPEGRAAAEVAALWAWVNGQLRGRRHVIKAQTVAD
jgi:chromosome partitioning protein